MTSLVQINLRRRLLCAATWEDILQEQPQLAWLSDVSDKAQRCRGLQEALAVVSADVREKLQLISLMRGMGCPVPNDIGGDLASAVIEFAGENGVDALAAYSDYKAGWFDEARNRFLEVEFESDVLR